MSLLALKFSITLLNLEIYFKCFTGISGFGITIKLNDLFKSQIKPFSLEQMILKALRHIK